MKIKFIVLAVSACCIFYACSTGKKASSKDRVQVSQREAEKKIEVTVDGKPFTSFTWPDSIFKPVLYPIINASGTEVSRGYPLNPRPGERVDHPHHIGIWFNYGNVNGIDFWGNSYDIPAATRNKTGGNIKYLRSEDLKSGSGKGGFTVYNSWQDPAGKELLYEKTTFEFLVQDSLRIIDRITTLTATTGNVTMPDTKEGMFALRVARQLELPAKEAVTLTDANNNPTTVPQLSNEGVTGNYRSSEGVEGDLVWGKRGRWMNLYGNIGEENISIVFCDHPKNPGYPTHWHARGYGLFAANPLGVKDFSEGKESFNFSIPSGQSATFRYRVVVSSNKHLSDQEINNLADDFGKKY